MARELRRREIEAGRMELEVTTFDLAQAIDDGSGAVSVSDTGVGIAPRGPAVFRGVSPGRRQRGKSTSDWSGARPLSEVRRAGDTA
jgi:hypothetical protein